jgi:3-phosphoshikimate 1-carboxyvinyltransferase
MDYLDLGPYSSASGTVRLPGSSISNRVLLLAALAEGETTITNLLDSDDTRVMLDALGKLGVKLARRRHLRRRRHARRVHREDGRSVPRQRRHGGAPADGGAAVNGGDYRVHGVPRMHERPIGDLVDGLRQIGADRVRAERRLSAAADQAGAIRSTRRSACAATCRASSSPRC